MKKLILVCFCMLCGLSYAQILQDFENGIDDSVFYFQKDIWSISDQEPIGGQNSLHHIFDNPESGSDAFFVQLPGYNFTEDTFKLQFSLRHAYNPSSANNWNVFLSGVQDILSFAGDLPEYSVVIGVNFTGSDDYLSVWQMVSGQKNKIFKTEVNYQDDIGKDSIPRFRVKLFQDSVYLAIYNSALTSWENIGDGLILNTRLINSAGFRYNYSSSQDRKIWFDDFYCDGEVYIDSVPPEIEIFEVIRDSVVRVAFTEQVDTNNFESKLYTGENRISKYKLVWSSKRECIIHSQKTFISGEKVCMIFNCVMDMNHNILGDTTVSGMYYKPLPGDVVINEIMADPEPSIGELEPFEYIEIFNNSEFKIDLNNWMVECGRTHKLLPAYLLKPDSFLILTCDEVQEFSGCSFLPIFSSKTSIRNAGTEILLKDSLGTVISGVTFKKEWYKNEPGADGGRSLERQNPSDECVSRATWKLSEDKWGGTPGKINSVYIDQTDNQAPQIMNIQERFPGSFSIEFDEIAFVDKALMRNMNTGQVIFPEQTENNDEWFQVDFSPLFKREDKYVLELQGISDLCMNKDNRQTRFYHYLTPEPGALVINELMIDPVPPVGLPGYEYIELINCSPDTVNLFGCTLLVDNQQMHFPGMSMLPGQYVIITSSYSFSNDTPFVCFEDFSLNNQYGDILLLNPANDTLDGVRYSVNWIADKNKKEGGWSIERIDYNTLSGDFWNWSGSHSYSGGTPGQENSVFQSLNDTTPPELSGIGMKEDTLVVLQFSESMAIKPVSDKQNYSLNDRQPLEIKLCHPQSRIVELCYSSDFSFDTDLKLEVSDELIDLAGNHLDCESPFLLSPGNDPERGDVVISEIMFNPERHAPEFIELCNISDMAYDISEMDLVYIEDADSVFFALSGLERYIFPGEYILIVKNKFSAIRAYDVEYSQISQVESFPSLTNGRGRLKLICSGEIIDDISYSEDMHHAIVDDPSGVSLERIQLDLSGNYSGNWHSASAFSGYSTPGRANSQSKVRSQTHARVLLNKKVFTPDLDGINDYLEIEYNLPDVGYHARVTVFCIKGYQIRHLVLNELTGNQGVIFWDGNKQDGTLAKPGPYILLIEFFHPSKKHIRKKKVCYLTYS